MNNETKTGRGGARANSGIKASGIETVTVRIDKRLLNVVTVFKQELKGGKSLDEIFRKNAPKPLFDDLVGQSVPKQDDAKLLKKIAELECDRDGFRDLYIEGRKENRMAVRELQLEVEALNLKLLRAMVGIGGGNGLDEKLRKRLIQFCHPDKHQDGKAKAIANELTKELTKLKG